MRPPAIDLARERIAQEFVLDAAARGLLRRRTTWRGWPAGRAGRVLSPRAWVHCAALRPTRVRQGRGLLRRGAGPVSSSAGIAREPELRPRAQHDVTAPPGPGGRRRDQFEGQLRIGLAEVARGLGGRAFARGAGLMCGIFGIHSTQADVRTDLLRASRAPAPRQDRRASPSATACGSAPIAAWGWSPRSSRRRRWPS